ncbi:tetratricopeptide repeat protein [Gemmata sp. JC717]|uniref:tetratricopeptide repeat protein n=1 Tax=Gemmata algarum TaxID=2975278 RepID=UPI0021BAAE72|nr:tetratricopeptide repeat protein [Gemmata algarum]MDY3554549.1 tetratricopeptide repeat protein [Gemmata algarum]
MPTINKRFLLKMLLALFAFSGALVAAHAVQASRIPAALKTQSDRAAEAGKTDVAIHYLRQYLEFKPEEIESQIKLAELLAQRPPTQRGMTDLLFLYDKILRLDQARFDPRRHDIRRQAFETALRAGKFTDAVTHGQALLQDFPTDAALWDRLAAAQTGLSQHAAARKSYEEAVRCAPDEITHYQHLAQLVWKNLDDKAGARAVLDRMVQALPQNPNAFLTRARFDTLLADEETVARQFARPIADLHRVIELDPEHAEAALLLAELMQRNRNIPAAHALLRDAVALYPKDLKIVRGLSWLELIRGNVAASITVLEDGLKATPDGFDLMVPLADLLIQQNDTVRTAEILKRLEARKAPPTQVKYLRARMVMREEKWDKAVNLIDALRRDPDVVKLTGLQLQLNLLSAACYSKLGDQSAEEKAYQRVTTADPKNVTARVGLGNLYLNQGRFDDAAREFESALQSPYATGTVVSQWVKLKARLLQSDPQANWTRLEAAVGAAAPRFGRGSVEPLLLRGEVLAAQGKLMEAVKLLRQETARRPADGHLWAALALTTADFSGCAAGLVVLDEAQASAGDCADVRLARAALYSREPGRVRPIEALAEHTESWPENEQLRLLSGLVEVYDRLGDAERVVQLLRRIVARQPSNVGVWLKLHERAGTGPAASAARAAIAKLETESAPSVVLCDARTATAETAPSVLPRVLHAFGADPTRADVCLALARLKTLTGDTTAAAELTERAFKLEPTRYECAEALVAQHAKAGATDRTAQLLARLANDPRWAGEPFRRMVGHVLPVLPAPVAANLLAQCRKLVERDPNGLPWMAESGVLLRMPEAANLVDEATRRPGATSDDWLRKALFASRDNPAAGPEVLATARAALPVATYFQLVAVYCDTAAGSTFTPEVADPAERRALAQARLSVKLSRSQAADGGKVLEAFLAGKDVPAADADWARRNLAMIYAVGGTPEDRVRAMNLIRTVVSTEALSPEELRATASVLTTLGRYLEGPDRRAVLNGAITSLAAAYKTTSAPSYLFAMSQLYRALGERRKSRECLQTLLNDEKDPSYAFYLRAALDELVEDNYFEAAATFAGRLTAKAAGDFNALASVARFECKAGRPERGLAIAEDYARVADGGSGDYLVRSARVAELLDELSRLPNVRGTPVARRMADAAVERYTAIVPNRPEAIVGAAGVLAADGRTADAFDRIERLNRYIPTRLRASAGLAIVRGRGEVTERQAELARKWLDDCLAEEPDSIPLLLNRAEFLALRRDTTGATNGFKEVIKKEPKNVIALNNLAWLLAADPATADEALKLVAQATREGGLTGELLDTRARVQITLKQYTAAHHDLAEAISHQPTALRWFHVAVLRMNQTPQQPEEARKAFQEAKRRGIEAKDVHPADLSVFKVLDAANKAVDAAKEK